MQTVGSAGDVQKPKAWRRINRPSDMVSPISFGFLCLLTRVAIERVRFRAPRTKIQGADQEAGWRRLPQVFVSSAIALSFISQISKLKLHVDSAQGQVGHSNASPPSPAPPIAGQFRDRIQERRHGSHAARDGPR